MIGSGPFDQITKTAGSSGPTALGKHLQQALTVSLESLRANLQQMFDNTDDILFEKARDSRNNAEQDEYFSAMREIRSKQADLQQRFFSKVRHDYQQIVQPDKDSEDLAHLANGGFEQLGLVAEQDLEEGLAVSDTVSRVESKNLQKLHALNQRFSVAASGRKVDEENNPVAPAQICRAFREAYEILDSPLTIRLAILKLFDKFVASELSSLYDAVNQVFIDAGILPNLSHQMPGRRTSDESKEDAEDETPSQPEPAANDTDASQIGKSAPGTKQDTISHEQQDALDEELFHTIKELLSGRRKALPPTGSAPARPGRAQEGVGGRRVTDSKQPAERTHAASSDDLLSVLSVMQAESLTAQQTQGAQPRTSAQLKSTISKHLRDISAGEYMGGGHEDTVDLTSLLFSHITEDDAVDNMIRSELLRLQIPFLKVAMMDQQFFTRRDHPARKLMNLISEAGQRWVSDGTSDKVLMPVIRRVIDRITSDFDLDVGVFETMFGELDTQLSKVKRKVRINEKRTLEASKGRERLTVAHQYASDQIEAATQGLDIPEIGKKLLTQSWANVIAVNYLRHGDENEPTQKSLKVMQDIIATITPRDSDVDRATCRKIIPELKEELKHGLTLAGHEHDDIENIVSRLAYAQGWAMSAPKGSKIPDELTKKDVAIGKGKVTGVAGQIAEAGAQLKREQQKPVSDEESETMLEIKKMSFGTWFDSVSNGNTVKQIKLSWYSPVSSHCLFVDKQGHKAEEYSLLEVARLMIAGELREAQIDKRPFFDRALDAIKRMLARAQPAVST